MADRLTRAYDLVMFDLDGTLIDTAPELCDALNDTLAMFDLPRVELAAVTRWIGHGTRELLVQALAHCRRSSVEAVRVSSELSVLSDAFDLHYSKRSGTRSLLYPQVLQVLHMLRLKGVGLAVVTNKDLRHTQPLLEYHRLRALIGLVVSGDTLPTRKPAPDGIFACLRFFGIAPERALFVGDSSIDVAAARNAGVPIWAVTYGYNMGQPIAASQPDRVIDNFGALLGT